MPMLENTAQANAFFDGTEIYAVSKALVEMPSIVVFKEANAAIWVEDELEYTITVRNIDPALDAEDVRIADTIMPALAVLVMDSVMMDDTTQLTSPGDFTYDETLGLLVITAIPDIAPGGSHKITFRVTKTRS